MTRPHQLVMEPDRAEARVINLIREARWPFVVEISTDVPHMKDVVCVAVDAGFEKREHYHYIPLRAVNRDEACQFAVNCIRDEISFAVTPEVMPDGRQEWAMIAERKRR